MKKEHVQTLRDIFRSAGYDVNESSRYDLKAEKAGYNTFIRFGTNPDIADMKLFVDQIDGNAGLYVAVEDVDPDIKQYGEKLGLIIWDKNEFATHIGKAVLADIEGTVSDLELVQPSIKSNYSEYEDKSMLSDIFSKSTSYESQGNYTNPEFSSSIESSFASSKVHLDLQAASINMDKNIAFVMGKPHVKAVLDAVLKLVPFWRYEYSLKLEKAYKSKIIDISGDGVGFLNGLNSHISNINISQVDRGIDIPDEKYELKNATISHEEAKDTILEMLIEEHTKDLRFDVTQGETIISEHKKFKPSVEDIDLILDLVYIPIWEVKGPRNSVELNAHTGEVLIHPVDNDVEFV